jgi:hypothetical protein
MLNYLGPNIGPGGPIAQQLPQATPGTMPQGVPGVPPTNAPIPTPPIHPAPSPHAVHGRHPAAPAALAAILHHAVTGNGVNIPPKPPEYGTITQSDGSIALHLKNPDGSMGPIVKIIPPIKRPGAA